MTNKYEQHAAALRPDMTPAVLGHWAEQARDMLLEAGQVSTAGYAKKIESLIEERDALAVAWGKGFKIGVGWVVYGTEPNEPPNPYAALSQAKAAPSTVGSLPERDQSESAEAQGLFRKFNVTRVDGSDKLGGKHHGCEYFVLDVDHDPHAKVALQVYAMACAESQPQLSAELIAKHGTGTLIDKIISKVEHLSQTVENCTAMTIINALAAMKATKEST